MRSVQDAARATCRSTGALAALEELPHVCRSERAHAKEHALEVHLPFLQRVLGEFSLVPLVVGDASPGEVAQGWSRCGAVRRRSSSSAPTCRTTCRGRKPRAGDAATLDAILALHGWRCTASRPAARYPINGLLQVARQRRLTPTLLDARNSGDTAGDRTRVVGYAAIAFCEPNAACHCCAWRATRSRHDCRPVRRGPRVRPLLVEPRAIFVTLQRHGELRGCVGQLDGRRPARSRRGAPRGDAAAFHDPRFPPLAREELAGPAIEVSLLSPRSRSTFAPEADVLARLDAGVARRGAAARRSQRRPSCPQVWEQLVPGRRTSCAT